MPMQSSAEGGLIRLVFDRIDCFPVCLFHH